VVDRDYSVVTLCCSSIRDGVRCDCVVDIATEVCRRGSSFLSHVSILTHDIDIVNLSVTFQYSMKTAQHVVIVSSPHGSPIILVLCVSNTLAKL